MVAGAGMAMGMLSSWMDNARTSFFTARLEQERIYVTFRRIRQHVASCPFLRTGVACCLPTCAQGSSVPNTGNLDPLLLLIRCCYGVCAFLGFWVLLGVLCIWRRVLALLVHTLHVYRIRATQVCLSMDTPSGRKWRFASYTSNLLEQMYDFPKRTMFHPK